MRDLERCVGTGVGEKIIFAQTAGLFGFLRLRRRRLCFRLLLQCRFVRDGLQRSWCRLRIGAAASRQVACGQGVSPPRARRFSGRAAPRLCGTGRQCAGRWRRSAIAATEQRQDQCQNQGVQFAISATCRLLLRGRSKFHNPVHGTRRNGSRRRRLPVAEKTAFATAGAITGTPGSPTPPGAASLSMMCTMTSGISASVRIG